MAGATYDRAYWMLPSAPGRPSYVSWMAGHGGSTLTIDRPGTGESSRPPADLLTMANEAGVLHQVVAEARTELHFRRVVLVGHSVGSSLALLEAATFHDVDGVIASGFLHTYGPKLGTLFSDMQPASQDPQFAAGTEPAGYLSTLPGTRSDFFYAAADSSPAVVGWDELTKSTMTTGEEQTIPAAADPAISRSVGVPVMISVGEYDQLFCGGPFAFPCSTAADIVRNEQSDYSPSAGPEGYVLPGAGHAMNLHENAVQWFAAAAGWLDRHFPS
ncbi:alpha/beta fold hydrolase [Streptomyces tateyamensis]|uniref:alpha/beta fold hydrolase n=1 Tax=Streptomyces tateyamensis TaxID=565073 RepID=UPI0011B6D2E7|nr:alpha/beta hydrolase [Streptomyces tateyamensis]